MALRKFYNTWYVYFKDVDGTQRTRSLKTTDRATAEALHRKFMLMLQAKKGELALMRCFPERFSAQLQIQTVVPEDREIAFCHRFKLERILPELAKIKEPSDSDRRRIKRFIADVGKKYADEITPEVALRYLEAHFTGGRNFKNFNNQRCLLNKVFRLLAVKMKIAQSPFELIPCRSVDDVESHRPISDDEFRRIFAAADEPFRTAACLGFYAGADMSTAFGLPCSAIDLDQRIIRWRRPKSGVKFICGIHRELFAMLQRIGFNPADPAPVLSLLGKPSPAARNNYFRDLFDSLGIRDTADGTASFHSLRASFFTRCDAANLHRRTTSLAGGHTDDRMNDLYSHDVSAAHEVESLPEIGILGDM